MRGDIVEQFKDGLYSEMIFEFTFIIKLAKIADYDILFILVAFHKNGMQTITIC